MKKSLIILSLTSILFAFLRTLPAFGFETVNTSSAKTFKLNLSYGCQGNTTDYCWTGPSPIIENGMIYAKGYDEFIYAINQNTGLIEKKYTQENHQSLFTPIINNGVLYAVNWQLFAFDLNTTKEKWKTGWAIRSNPTINNNVIFYGERNGLSALDAKNGIEVWHVNSADAYFSSPFVHDGHVYIGSYDPSQMRHTDFYSFNEKTGEEEWHLNTGYDYYSTPCAINNTIYVGETYLVAIDTHKQKQPAYQWTYHSKNVFSHFMSPHCDNNRVYVGSRGENLLYAFDSETGKIAWTFRASNEESLSNDIYSTPNVDDDAVFIGSDNHYLYAIYKKTGKLKWQFKADDAIRSKPIISKGVVYFTTNAGTLYAIDEKSGQING